jgi:hypothetical protein
VLCEADGVTPVQVYNTDEKEEFLNDWGDNIHSRPTYIFHPKTKIGACNIVKWACQKNSRVRAVGYRSTWTNVYSDHEHVLVSLLGLKHAVSDDSVSVDRYLCIQTKISVNSVFLSNNLVCLKIRHECRRRISND